MKAFILTIVLLSSTQPVIHAVIHAKLEQPLTIIKDYAKHSVTLQLPETIVAIYPKSAWYWKDFYSARLTLYFDDKHYPTKKELVLEKRGGDRHVLLTLKVDNVPDSLHINKFPKKKISALEEKRKESLLQSFSLEKPSPSAMAKIQEQNFEKITLEDNKGNIVLAFGPEGLTEDKWSEGSYSTIKKFIQTNFDVQLLLRKNSTYLRLKDWLIKVLNTTKARALYYKNLLIKLNQGIKNKQLPQVWK